MSKLPGKDSIFWESPALLKGLAPSYPKHYKGLIPLYVKAIKNVSPDFNLDGKCGNVDKNTVYAVWVNSYGAVTAECANGTRLGLRPDEFDVVKWYDPKTKEIVRFETKEIRIKGDGEHEDG